MENELSTFHSPLSTFQLPLDCLPLHRHRHASGTATAAGELVANKGDHTFLVVIEAVSSFDDIGSRNHVKTRLVDGIDGVTVTGITEELARSEAEEVGATMPLFTGWEQTVAATATEDRFHRNTKVIQSDHQIGLFLGGDFLTVNNIMNGLECRIHDDGFVGHAAVHIEHGKYHVEVDERFGCQW